MRCHGNVLITLLLLHCPYAFMEMLNGAYVTVCFAVSLDELILTYCTYKLNMSRCFE